MKYAEIDAKRLLLPKEHSHTKCQNGENLLLAKSIAKFGVLSPIYVKELTGGGCFEIISGKRRFCASRLAGIKKIPCYILKKDENANLIGITLDIWGKSDLFDLADRLKNLLLKSNGSAEELAEKLGLDISSFLNLLTPTCMSLLERRIARENCLSDEEIRKISSISSREERLTALISSKKSYSSPKISVLKQKEHINARRRIALGGLGFFENTLKRAVDILTASGISVSKSVEEKSGEINYVVKIKAHDKKESIKQ